MLGFEGLRFCEGAGEADQTAAQRDGEGFGAGREDHPASAAHQEWVVEELAKATEGVAHCGLSHARTLGGLGDAALAGQSVEGDQ